MTAITLLGCLTIDEERGDAECSRCGMGVNASGLTSGWIQQADMLASFVVAHATHDKNGFPSGLTPTGRPSKRAQPTIHALMVELASKRAKP